MSALRTKFNILDSNRSFNKDRINPTNKNIKLTSIFGFIAFPFSLILIFVFIISEKNYLSDKQLYLFPFVFYIIFMILSLIFACLNINKLNKLKDIDSNDDNITISRVINLIIVILGFSFCAYMIFLLTYIFNFRERWSCECKKCCCYKTKTGNINYTNKSSVINNNTAINETNNNIEKDSGLDMNKK